MQIITLGCSVVWHAWVGTSGEWVAACDELGMTIQEPEFTDLFSTAYEAASLLFEDLLLEGELVAYCSSKHWAITQQGTGSPVWQFAFTIEPFEQIPKRYAPQATG